MLQKVKNSHCENTEHFQYILGLEPGPSKEGKKSSGMYTGRHPRVRAQTHRGRNAPWPLSLRLGERMAPPSRSRVLEQPDDFIRRLFVKLDF